MNTYIYHTVNGYIMIDTGYEHSMKNVEKRANKQGIAFSEIKYIFLTHAHDDHAGFLNELLSKYPRIKGYHKSPCYAHAIKRTKFICWWLQ